MFYENLIYQLKRKAPLCGVIQKEDPLRVRVLVYATIFSIPVILIFSTIIFELIGYDFFRNLDIFNHLKNDGLFEYWPKIGNDYLYLIDIGKPEFAEKFVIYYCYVLSIAVLFFCLLGVASIVEFLFISTPLSEISIKHHVLYPILPICLFGWLVFILVSLFKSPTEIFSNKFPTNEASFYYIVVFVSGFFMSVSAYLVLLLRLFRVVICKLKI